MRHVCKRTYLNPRERRSKRPGPASRNGAVNTAARWRARPDGHDSADALRATAWVRAARAGAADAAQGAVLGAGLSIAV